MVHKKLIHIGCGLTVAERWENYDSSPWLIVRHIPIVGRFTRSIAPPFPSVVRYGNIALRPLCAARSADAVFASHVFEHLAHEEMRSALRNVITMLRPGGLLRLVVPDLELRARHYLDALRQGDPTAANWFMQDTHLGRVRRGRGITGRLREIWGAEAHLWMYDYSSIAHLLSESGFVDIRRAHFGDSVLPEFAEVENKRRFVNALGEELAVECRAP